MPARGSENIKGVSMKKVKKKNVTYEFVQGDLPEKLVASCPVCKLQFMFSADLGGEKLVLGRTVCGRLYESVDGVLSEV